jgi:hypothetical protein
MNPSNKRYNDLNRYLRNLFGCRVQKITVDAGLSCPNRDGTISTGGCIYCNERGSGTGAHKKGLSITRQLETAKKRLEKRYKAKKFLAYFQSYSNTYAPLPKLRFLYEQALSVKDIVGLSIGTRPDCVNEDVLSLLSGYARNHLIWIEYGLQSANDKTLEYINRGHDFQCFKDAVLASQNRNIKICAHVIIGLPGETDEDLDETARAISDLQIDGVKLHLLYVIKNTSLEKMLRQGRYACLIRREYVERVCNFLEKIPESVIIHRLTGDPHPHELIAPQWSLNKRQTLDLIDETLEKRNSRQGSRNRLPAG